MKFRVLVSIFIIAGLVVGSGYLLRNNFSGEQSPTPANQKQKKAPKVLAIPVTASSISRTLDLTGSVVPYRIARLASPAEGPVLSIMVREGDQVKADTPLASIGRKKAIDVLLSSLQEELRQEEENLNRTRQLVKSNALPGEQLDQARVSFEKVRAQLARTEEMVKDYSIAAPWEGTVSKMLVKTGEFVAPRAALIEMYDPASLSIRAAVPEKYSAAVTAGLGVDVRLDAYPGKVIKGRIERVYPYLDERLRTRTIEIALLEPVDLLPGMFARLTLQLETKENVIVVSNEAVLPTPKGKSAFVVKEGKAEKRVVKTGIEQAAQVEIISGISVGEMLIVSGNQKLKDGVPVTIGGNKKQSKGSSGTPGQSPAKKKMTGGQGE